MAHGALVFHGTSVCTGRPFDQWSVLQGLTKWIAVTVIFAWQSSTRVHHWVMSLRVFFLSFEHINQHIYFRLSLHITVKDH